MDELNPINNNQTPPPPPIVTTQPIIISATPQITDGGKHVDNPKHPGGRPPLYTNVEDVQKIIDEYFEYCDNKTKEIHSEKLGDMIVPDPEPYTMSGLAYRLGMSRKSLINYERKDEFLHAIKEARNKVEIDVERRMNGKETFTAGLIFNLKNNFGWKDQTEIDHTTGGEKIPPVLGGASIIHVPTNNSNEQTA